MITYTLSNPLAHDTSKVRDIHKLQRALKADGFYHGLIDGIFGTGTAGAAKTAKWRYGYPAKYVLPTAGQQLYDYLTGAVGLPPAYRIRRRQRGFGGDSPETKLRNAIVFWAEWGVTHEPEIHYTMDERRDDWLRHAAGALPLTTDCSGFVTACYRWAGAADPSGFGYRVVGFTGTLLDHGSTIPLSQARIGDLVIWGAHPGHHVAVIVDVSNAKDPMLVSHGREGGPNHVRLSAETAAQRRSYVVKQYIPAL